MQADLRRSDIADSLASVEKPAVHCTKFGSFRFGTHLGAIKVCVAKVDLINCWKAASICEMNFGVNLEIFI